MSTNFIDFVVEKIAIIDLNWIGKIIQWLINGIGIIGVGIIVFTLIIKTVTMPLDVFSRVKMKKQSLIMKKMRPQMEKLQKQYANRPDILRQKQYELQKGSMNIFTSCLPMIFTLVIFGLVFQGFREYIVNYNQTIVSNLYNDVYLQFFKDNAEAISQKCNIQFMNGNDFIEGFVPSYDYIRQAGLIEKLNETLVTGYKPESWLWVKNVFMSDTWANVIPSFSNFTSTGFGGIGATLPEMAGVSYDQIMTPIINNYNKTNFWNMSRWNGYFILPILSIATSFLSTTLQQKMQPVQMTGDEAQQKQQRIMNKTMTYLMPVVLGIFAIMYSAAFAIYYFVSNFMTMITSISFNLIIKNLDKKKQNQPIIIQQLATKNTKKSNKAKK